MTKVASDDVAERTLCVIRKIQILTLVNLTYALLRQIANLHR